MTATTEYITTLEDENDRLKDKIKRLKAQLKQMKEKNAVDCSGEASEKWICPNCNFDKLKCPRCCTYYTDS
jgi:rubrerythrin